MVYGAHMGNFRISQLAGQAGVPTSTVRYYERVGLLPVPERSSSGYRTYDERAATRLLFITRGKRLGLSLDEIAELVAIWDGTNCGATQERLSALLDTKRVEIADQIRELEHFADQLADVQERLAASPGSDRCATDLNCCAPTLTPTPIALGVQRRDPGAGEDEPVVACTLTPDERPARVDEFATLAQHVTSWSRDDTTLRLRFPAREDLAALVQNLSLREEACCGFLSFTVHEAANELCWDIQAPNTQTAPTLDEFLPLLAPDHEVFSR